MSPPTAWTVHEADFLAWTRLRSCLGQTLGTPEPRLLRPADASRAEDRPHSLRACSAGCARRVAALMVRQGLAVPDASRKAWLLPAASATAIEACWNLVPGFHGRWETLWDLRTLEDRWGARSFPALAAAELLAARDAQSHASPLHRPERSDRATAPAPDLRVRTAAAEGWLQEAQGGLRLAALSQDALTLLRLVAGSRVQLPPGSLDRIGRIHAPARHARPG